MKNNILGSYINGNYTVTIYTDGTKIRENDLDNLTPSFAENCDVKITDKCDGGCEYCYEGCTSTGKHANLFNYEFIKTLHPYTELALNGNNMSHPQLVYFLKLLKEQKVIPNITVNQKHFIKYYNYLKALVDSKLIYGVGVSLIDSSDTDFIKKIKTFPNLVIHTICGITNLTDYDILINNNIKTLVLGYKTTGRGITYQSNNINKIEFKTQLLKDYINMCLKTKNNFLISFDNLAIEQLNIKDMLTEEEWNNFYMGDDGQYTFYIDMVEGKFAKNSVSNIRYDIGNLTVDEMFNIIHNERK